MNRKYCWFMSTLTYTIKLGIYLSISCLWNECIKHFIIVPVNTWRVKERKQNEDLSTKHNGLHMIDIWMWLYYDIQESSISCLTYE